MKQNPDKKKLIRRAVLIAAPLLGVLGGYLYYSLVGCASGTCPITSNPLASVLYGAVLGLLLGEILAPDKKKELPEEQ